MKILLSPAKSLDFERSVPKTAFNHPQYLSKSLEIMDVLKEMKPSELETLMKVSSKLASLNWTRNQNWSNSYDQSQSRQAIFAFTGDVYQGLDVDTLKEEELNYIQKELRILSGLYGMLKPLDYILPYRLEMGTKIEVEDASNLYKFWRPLLTEDLQEQMDNEEFVLNLASNEYSKAIDFKSLNNQVVTPHFKDLKDGKLKMISFYAKKARGMMLKYCAQNKIEEMEDLKGFNSGGYAFDNSLSDETNLVFTR
jgi:hypothetical protein